MAKTRMGQVHSADIDQARVRFKVPLTRDNVVSGARRQQLVPGDAVDDGSDFAPAEPVKDKCCDVRLSDPRRAKLWSVRDY